MLGSGHFDVSPESGITLGAGVLNYGARSMHAAPRSFRCYNPLRGFANVLPNFVTKFTQVDLEPPTCNMVFGGEYHSKNDRYGLDMLSEYCASLPPAARSEKKECLKPRPKQRTLRHRRPKRRAPPPRYNPITFVAPEELAINHFTISNRAPYRFRRIWGIDVTDACAG